jgi:hypothetical protein
VRGRAGTRGTKLHMRLVRLGISDKFLEIVNWEVLACDQHNWDLSDENDRCEIGHCVVQRMLVQRLALRMRADGAEYEFIAVRCGLSDTRRASHPAGTRVSTMACWPSTSLIRPAMTRPSTSVGPPAANGMTIVTGRVGKSCAPAEAPNAIVAAAIAANNLIFISSNSDTSGAARRHADAIKLTCISQNFNDRRARAAHSDCQSPAR